MRAILKNKKLALSALTLLILLTPVSAYAATTCGSGDNAIKTSIDYGCRAQGNPIIDMAFAFIRFLSVGVGIVLVGSTVYAGMQYTASRGDPNATANAIKRLQSNGIALLVFIFGFALLNYVIPGQILK